MKVVITGDWHIGSRSSIFLKNKKLLQERWDGKLLILIGDLIDCGIDRGMQFDNNENTQDQINEVEDFLMDFKVLGYVTGNHEERIFIKTGIRLYESMLHMEPSNEIDLGGKHFYISHGISAAQNTFLEHDKFLRYIPESDVLALGHSHELAKRSVLRGGKLMYIVRTGSFLVGARYANNAGMAPKVPGWCEYDTVRSHLELLGLVNGRVKRL